MPAKTKRKKAAKKKAKKKAARKRKPVAKVIGQDSNVFMTLGLCTRALKDAGQKKEADEMNDRVTNCGSYDEALQIMQEYCKFA